MSDPPNQIEGDNKKNSFFFNFSCVTEPPVYPVFTLISQCLAKYLKLSNTALFRSTFDMRRSHCPIIINLGACPPVIKGNQV